MLRLLAAYLGVAVVVSGGSPSTEDDELVGSKRHRENRMLPQGPVIGRVAGRGALWREGLWAVTAHQLLVNWPACRTQLG